MAIRAVDISASHYPPTVEMGFTGAPPPLNSDSYDQGRRSYFQTYKHENISRLQMPNLEWGKSTSIYTPHPDVSAYKNGSKHLKFPHSQITMLDGARQQDVDDFYMACQLHRNQYKDHSRTLHPLDYFKQKNYMYQCPGDPTSAYFKAPTYYTKYKDPLVLPLTLERANRLPPLPQRALTGVYNRTSFVGRR
ncbi:unnamed protein product [Ceutorhynchus assimilis]|uniref:Uncharacterized protein n=1 Tax=Ceutorhynchus assimilis TaxID=467358 RepID=A0A9N9MJ84_9CUCU|nr:unnamed protein product [Ceutorhynchus assimilis]